MHDEVVAVVAWLFRSLRLDAIVEPTSLFDHNLGDVSNQRPDIHIRNPRKSGKQVIIDVALTGVDGQSRASDEAVEICFMKSKLETLRLRRMSQVKILFSSVRLVLTRLIMNG